MALWRWLLDELILVLVLTNFYRKERRKCIKTNSNFVSNKTCFHWNGCFPKGLPKSILIIHINIHKYVCTYYILYMYIYTHIYTHTHIYISFKKKSSLLLEVFGEFGKKKYEFKSNTSFTLSPRFKGWHFHSCIKRSI